MIGTIKIRERGPTPRGMGRRMNALKRKAAFRGLAMKFHTDLRDKRFTKEHAREAGYAKRKGEEGGLSQREYFRSYTGRKQRTKGHTRPLEFSGQTRHAVASGFSASVVATNRRTTVRNRYPGARKLNLRHPKSNVYMHREFVTITSREADDLAASYDEELNQVLLDDQAGATRQIV